MASRIPVSVLMGISIILLILKEKMFIIGAVTDFLIKNGRIFHYVLEHQE